MTRVPRASLVGTALVVAIVIFFVLWLVPGAKIRNSRVEAKPRDVSPRGALVPNEQSLIDLFEKTRVSVVYITTEARVLDLSTRNGVPKLLGRLDELRVGDTIRLTIWRNGTKQEVRATLEGASQ